MMYIDLNMVRAGVVRHPKEWGFCGYNEIMNPRERYSIIDHKMLMAFFRVKSHRRLQEEYNMFLNMELEKETCNQEPNWSNSIAVGSEGFILDIKNKLGIKAEKRKVDNNEDSWILHEPGVSYN